MHDDLYDGLAEEIDEGTRILLDRGWEATRVLEEALVAGWLLWESIFVTASCSCPRY